MTNTVIMDASFERQKNVKAFTYTAVICGILALFLTYVYFQLPTIQPPQYSEGIEVNLGYSDDGLGDDIPEIPGEPAAADEAVPSTPEQNSPQPATETVKPIVGDENETDETAPIVKPQPKPEKKPATPTTKPETPVVKNNPTPVNKPVVNNTPKKSSSDIKPVQTKPATPQPKAVFKGGTATNKGGNNGESYKNVMSQGDGKTGGDKGNPNGNPYSPNYSGNAPSGNSGVSIRSGLQGRRFKTYPSFQDDFNQPAKVAVDITVDASGNVTSAVVNPKGTTTTDANIRAIALRKARQLKMTPDKNGNDGQGTIVFDFKLKG